jgi:hypothetical protein
MTHVEGLPGRTGSGGCDTDREMLEPGGSPASRAADQNRSMQALVPGAARAERVVARSFRS